MAFLSEERPKLVIATIMMILFLILSSIISVWRTSSRGGSTQIQDLTPVEIFLSSFEEAGTFFTSSLVLSVVPSKYPYIGAEPLVTTILHPIPRKILADKPTGDYTSRIQDDIYTTQGSLGPAAIPWKSHTAFLSFVEYYLVAGWPSLVLISFALGVLMRSYVMVFIEAI